MAIIAGGDIQEISLDNPEVGVTFFQPVSGEENTIDIGGITPDDNGAVTTSGTLINSYKRNVGMSEIMVASDEPGAGDYEAAYKYASSTKETTITISMLNGVVYKANGSVIGLKELNVFKSTFSLPFKSGLGFVKQ